MSVLLDYLYDNRLDEKRYYALGLAVSMAYIFTHFVIRCEG